MKILLLDTSKPIVWGALVQDSVVIMEKEWEGDTTLGVKLLEVIEELTAGSRPDRIAVYRGPGHFMATRTGVVTAQLLAQAWGAELVEVTGNERGGMVQQALVGQPVEVVSVSYS